jgi:hypothetical protein
MVDETVGERDILHVAVSRTLSETGKNDRADAMDNVILVQEA